mmetsp:Transcript_40896/g.45578  ORF Transcript_40896/g.45578 Transcript_40896/m.45578 type:complete len:230 (+) Transcript_40896:93-782(+)
MTSIIMMNTTECNRNGNNNSSSNSNSKSSSNSTQIIATNIIDINTKLFTLDMDVDVDTHVDTDRDTDANDRMKKIRPPPFEFIVECVRQLHYDSDQHHQPQHQPQQQKYLNHRNENMNREECDTENDTGRKGHEKADEGEYNTLRSEMSLRDLIYQEAENEADAILNASSSSSSSRDENDNEQDNDIDIDIDTDTYDDDTMVLDPDNLAAIVVDVELIERCYLRHNNSL